MYVTHLDSIQILFFDMSLSGQAAWLRSFLIWLLCEVCFVSTLVVMVVHYCIPCFVVLGDVGHIGRKLQESVSAYHRSLLDRAAGGAFNKECGPEEEVGVGGQFNSADFLFVSTRVARLYPALAAAKVIGHFRTVWPRRSYQHVSDAAQTYQNNGFNFFVGSFGTILIFTLQSFLYLPEGLQGDLTYYYTMLCSCSMKSDLQNLLLYLRCGGAWLLGCWGRLPGCAARPAVRPAARTGLHTALRDRRDRLLCHPSQFRRCF